MFLYKHNAYKHIQPGISGKNKHLLSIFPVSSLIQRSIKNPAKHLR